MFFTAVAKNAAVSATYTCAAAYGMSPDSSCPLIHSLRLSDYWFATALRPRLMEVAGFSGRKIEQAADHSTNDWCKLIGKATIQSNSSTGLVGNNQTQFVLSNLDLFYTRAGMRLQMASGGCQSTSVP